MLTKMIVRCPDKPIRATQDMIIDFDGETDWIATAKYDGYRCIQDWDGETVQFFSRRDTDKGGPTIHPASETLRAEATQWFKENKIPKNTRIDSEWLGRRTNGPETLRNFGIQYLDGVWIGREPELVRWDLISTYVYNQPHVLLAESATENFTQFFADLKKRDVSKDEKDWRIEGMVIKHKDAKYLGNIKVCAKNPRWFKAKWRDGASGKDTSASF